MPSAGAEGAQLRPVGPRGAALEDETLDMDIAQAAAVRGEDAIAGRDLDRALRGGGVALKMHEQLLTIIARQPTARRLDELLPRGHLVQRLIIEENQRIALAHPSGLFLRRLWRADERIAEDKRRLRQRRGEDAGRSGTGCHCASNTSVPRTMAACSGTERYTMGALAAAPARGRDPFVIDPRADGDDISRLGELGGGIDGAERVIGRAVGGVGCIRIRLAHEPLSGQKRWRRTAVSRQNSSRLFIS